MLDNVLYIMYNIKRPLRFGGIAQLARACGSYPQCQWFKSTYRYHTECPYWTCTNKDILFLCSYGKRSILNIYALTCMY